LDLGEAIKKDRTRNRSVKASLKIHFVFREISSFTHVSQIKQARIINCSESNLLMEEKTSQKGKEIVAKNQRA
jgi:hypothetical protein